MNQNSPARTGHSAKGARWAKGAALEPTIPRPLPMAEWPIIQMPAEHVETQVGRWLAMFEGIADYCIQIGHLDLGTRMLMDLIKLSKFGRPKADLNLQTSRVEMDFSKLSEDELNKIKALAEGPAEEMTNE